MHGRHLPQHQPDLQLSRYGRRVRAGRGRPDLYRPGHRRRDASDRSAADGARQCSLRGYAGSHSLCRRTLRPGRHLFHDGAAHRSHLRPLCRAAPCQRFRRAGRGRNGEVPRWPDRGSLHRGRVGQRPCAHGLPGGADPERPDSDPEIDPRGHGDRRLRRRCDTGCDSQRGLHRFLRTGWAAPAADLCSDCGPRGGRELLALRLGGCAGEHHAGTEHWLCRGYGRGSGLQRLCLLRERGALHGLRGRRHLHPVFRFWRPVRWGSLEDGGRGSRPCGDRLRRLSMSRPRTPYPSMGSSRPSRYSPSSPTRRSRWASWPTNRSTTMAIRQIR